MKLVLITAGKTRISFVLDGLNFYNNRIKSYLQWEIVETQDVKGISDIKKMIEVETLRISKNLKDGDYIILLDEKGQNYDSVLFAANLNRVFEAGTYKRVVFIIAGAYGASHELKKRANAVWALSYLTFPHQLVRLVLTEQVYRALTIMRNEPYHHV